jgi:hypothetical protein
MTRPGDGHAALPSRPRSIVAMSFLFRGWRDVLAFGVPLAVYLATPAAVLNGDGLGYYNCARHSSWADRFRPGHLLYCPLMSVLGGAAERVDLATLSSTMLVSNQLAGAVGVALVLRIARRLGMAPFGQWLAALGLAASFGFWIQATDVEAYALALLFVIGSIDLLTRYLDRGHPSALVGLGLLNGLAASFHLSTIALVPAGLCATAWRERTSWPRWSLATATYVASLAAAFLAPVIVVAVTVLNLRATDIPAWLVSSRHAYRVTLDELSVPRALYGFGRAFVYMERFYDGPLWSVALKGAGLASAAAWIAWRTRPFWRRLTPATRVLLGISSGFVLLQTMLGIYFFPSDSERWVFLLPLVWLAIAGPVATLPRRERRAAVAAVSALAVVNLAQGIWPAATDLSIPQKVRAFDRALPQGALVVTPGQDWVDYYTYFTGKELSSLRLVNLALTYRDDRAAFFRHVERDVDAARRAGRTIALVRLLDAGENYTHSPWPEMRAFGHSPAGLREWFRRYPWVEQRLGDPQATLVHWHPGPPPER